MIIRAGRFREDFYYRLCSDVITTPSLRVQLAEAPDDLPLLVGFIARRLGGAAEAERLTAEVVDWIRAKLPAEYTWPGNFRECMRDRKSTRLNSSH